MKIVHLPTSDEFFDVLIEQDLYIVLRHRRSGDEFVVSRRTFAQFRTLTHPTARITRSRNAKHKGDTH